MNADMHTPNEAVKPSTPCRSSEPCEHFEQMDAAACASLRALSEIEASAKEARALATLMEARANRLEQEAAYWLGVHERDYHKVEVAEAARFAARLAAAPSA